MENENEPNVKRRSWLSRYISVAALVVIGYFVYLLFFSSHSAMKKVEYQRVIDSLEREVSATTDSVAYYHKLNQQLRSDPRAVEQVVREEHNMNRPGEDVYLMEAEN
ncbi:MAG: septum formation initiator family protein [Muribaculaceae bacterium]|nr:septum formation initiator family protein [Muribaculaceae bacterium]MDE6332240.1 septum formation initiator family protein [Muribaculaceae bacterium]